MTLEETIDLETWQVLQKVKKEFLRTPSGKIVEYWTSDVIGGDGPGPAEEILALERLEVLGVFQILNPGGIGEYE